MTEQRFIYKQHYNAPLAIGEAFDGNKKLTVQEMVELLNEQQATIKELEEEIKLLKPTNIEQYEQIVQLQDENEQLKQYVDFYKYFQKDARELEKENDTLKKEIKRLKCMNNQLERRLDYSIAYDMGECE